MWSIMLRPKAVVEEEISKQGILPTTAPVKPYTLFALTCATPDTRYESPGNSCTMKKHSWRKRQSAAQRWGRS